ncbi:hypothetical protein K474DRAFT_1671850 [Panus rudis PR-1116 ss-1]|nr:hypothetical protein K474DRAFT_1671850 [Panus rudis PR-1116 ss-1]
MSEEAAESPQLQGRGARRRKVSERLQESNDRAAEKAAKKAEMAEKAKEKAKRAKKGLTKPPSTKTKNAARQDANDEVPGAAGSITMNSLNLVSKKTSTTPRKTVSTSESQSSQGPAIPPPPPKAPSTAPATGKALPKTSAAPKKTIASNAMPPDHAAEVTKLAKRHVVPNPTKKLSGSKPQVALPVSKGPATNGRPHALVPSRSTLSKPRVLIFQVTVAIAEHHVPRSTPKTLVTSASTPIAAENMAALIPPNRILGRTHSFEIPPPPPPPFDNGFQPSLGDIKRQFAQVLSPEGVDTALATFKTLIAAEAGGTGRDATIAAFSDSLTLALLNSSNAKRARSDSAATEALDAEDQPRAPKAEKLEVPLQEGQVTLLKETAADIYRGRMLIESFYPQKTDEWITTTFNAACDELGVVGAVLTADVATLIHRTGSIYRSNLKDHGRHIATQAYGLRAGREERNKLRVAALLANDTYIYPKSDQKLPPCERSLSYQHEGIMLFIKRTWFNNHASLGVRRGEHLTEMPKAAIAFACTMWSSGRYVSTKFNEIEWKKVYTHHEKRLMVFENSGHEAEMNGEINLYTKFAQDMLRDARIHAGVDVDVNTVTPEEDAQEAWADEYSRRRLNAISGTSAHDSLANSDVPNALDSSDDEDDIVALNPEPEAPGEEDELSDFIAEDVMHKRVPKAIKKKKKAVAVLSDEGEASEDEGKSEGAASEHYQEDVALNEEGAAGGNEREEYQMPVDGEEDQVDGEENQMNGEMYQMDDEVYEFDEEPVEPQVDEYTEFTSMDAVYETGTCVYAGRRLVYDGIYSECCQRHANLVEHEAMMKHWLFKSVEELLRLQELPYVPFVTDPRPLVQIEHLLATSITSELCKTLRWQLYYCTALYTVPLPPFVALPYPTIHLFPIQTFAMGPIRTNTPVKPTEGGGESNTETKSENSHKAPIPLLIATVQVEPKKTPASGKQKAPYPSGKGSQKDAAKQVTGEKAIENRRQSTRLSTPKPTLESDSVGETALSPSPDTPAEHSTPTPAATVTTTATAEKTAPTETTAPAETNAPAEKTAEIPQQERVKELTAGSPTRTHEQEPSREHEEKNGAKREAMPVDGGAAATPETHTTLPNATLQLNDEDNEHEANPWQVVQYKKNRRIPRTTLPTPELSKSANVESLRQEQSEAMDTTSVPSSPTLRPEAPSHTRLDVAMDAEQTLADAGARLPSIDPDLERVRKRAREASPERVPASLNPPDNTAEPAGAPSSSKIANIVANRPFTFRFKKLPPSDTPAPPSDSLPVQTPQTQPPAVQTPQAQTPTTQTPSMQTPAMQALPLDSTNSAGGDLELDFEVSDDENDVGGINEDDEGSGDIAAMVRDSEEFQPSFASQVLNETYELLPTPNLDAIRPYRNQPLWATLHQDRRQKSSWLGRPGIKLIVHAWGNRADPSINTRLIHDMTAMIRSCLDLPPNSSQVCVSPPAPVADVNNKKDAKRPYGFLVTEIDESQKAKLLDRQIWITRRMTLSFYDDGCLFDDFVCMLGGFTANNPKDIRLTIQKALKHRDTQAIIRPMASAPGDPDASSAAVKELHKKTLLGLQVKTIEIMRFAEGADRNTSKAFPHTFATVHMPSPTLHPLQIRQWGNWVNHVSKMKFSTTMSGVGAAIPPYTCGGCFGVGHPTGMCPFKKILNWTDPAFYGLNELDHRSRPTKYQQGRNNRGPAHHSLPQPTVPMTVVEDM